ncbi:MAG: ribokinase [Pirellulales bacterium]|nr:ribokinase [Pirellulales bacterium]
MRDKIVIAGSCIAALSMKGARFPAIGETVLAELFLSEAGGKGTNQALAAARLGGDVAMIGCVGDDLYGQGIVGKLAESGISVEGIRQQRGAHTGIAFVLIDGAGRNMIEIAPGGNFQLGPGDIERNEHLVTSAAIIGFQLETNVEFVEYGVKRAHALGVKTLLDPAPAQRLDPSVYAFLDFIKPNEVEAGLLTGINVVDVKTAFQAAKWFLRQGVKNALVTLGPHGVVVLNHELERHILPPQVPIQDTTAAGDVFCGALMHRLAEGADLAEACEFAVYASALSVQVVGAMKAMPTTPEVLDFMQHAVPTGSHN